MKESRYKIFQKKKCRKWKMEKNIEVKKQRTNGTEVRIYFKKF